MATIQNKFLCYQTKSGFEADLEASKISDKSIVFVLSDKFIYSHGEYFYCDFSPEVQQNIVSAIVELGFKTDEIDDVVATALNDLNTGLTDLGQDIDTVLNEKVDKVAGKGLSTNDYSTAEKNKLSGIAAGAEVNVQADWNATSTTSDAYIQNKPRVLPSIFIGTCASTGATQNKVATVDTDFTLTKGVVVAIKYSATNSYSATASAPITLNVNNTGAFNIYYSGSNANTGTNNNAYGYVNRYIYYMYDGTQWVWLSQGIDSNTTYSSMTEAEINAGTSTTARLVTPQRLNNWLTSKLWTGTEAEYDALTATEKASIVAFITD